MTTGMTRKQYAKARFLRLLDTYRLAKQDISTPEKKREFVLLSVAIWAARADVPRSYWRLINKDSRGQLSASQQR